MGAPGRPSANCSPGGMARSARGHTDDGFDFSVITANWEYLAKGLRYTVQVTLFAMVGGIVLGTLLAMMRLSSIKPLSLFAAGYVNLFRSIPLVQVILAFYLIIPIAMSLFTGEMRPIGAENSAYFTFTIFEAAYYSEIMRAGIQSIPKGQVGAGYASASPTAR